MRCLGGVRGRPMTYARSALPLGGRKALNPLQDECPPFPLLEEEEEWTAVSFEGWAGSRRGGRKMVAMRFLRPVSFGRCAYALFC